MQVPSPPAVPRTIVELSREAEAEVILGLDCGHRRHVRHRPPLSEHPWVLDDSSSEARVGGSIECLRCGQRLLPEGARVYRRTSTFDESTVPAGLLGDHATKAGTWGRLVVEDGQVDLWFAPPLSVLVRGRPGEAIVIPTELRHHVRLAGPVRFHVEFLRCAVEPG